MSTNQESHATAFASGPGIAPVEVGAAIQAALACAILAPSTHNTQPWVFHVRGATIEVRADRLRALRVVDPMDRELTISCGAAMFLIRLGLRCSGFFSTVKVVQDARDADLLACVTVGDPALPTADELALYDAIRQRHANNHPYFGMEVPASVITALAEAAAAEGASFTPLLDEGDRIRLVALVMDGDHRQWSDTRFRRELASWLRPEGDPRHDGMTGFASRAIGSRLAAGYVRAFDLGNRRAAHDRDLVEGSALVGIIATAGDMPFDWLHAGAALVRVLLVATLEGMGASFLNQPVEEPDLRVVLDTLLTTPWRAQSVLRMGYAPQTEGTLRRPVSEVQR